MSRVALFSLSCLITLSILSRTTAMSPRNSKIAKIPHPDWQCLLAGHRAACYEHLHNGDSVDCMDLKCVKKNSRPRLIDGKVRGVGIGKATDGTHCNINKVCQNGLCKDITKNERMPMEEGSTPDIYKCFFKS